MLVVSYNLHCFLFLPYGANMFSFPQPMSMNESNNSMRWYKQLYWHSCFVVLPLRLLYRSDEHHLMCCYLIMISLVNKINIFHRTLSVTLSSRSPVYS